jgi:hypothetical protein
VAERQTHQLEGLAIARSWRFESSLPHQSNQQLTDPAGSLSGLPAGATVGTSFELTFTYRNFASSRKSVIAKITTTREPFTNPMLVRAVIKLEVVGDSASRMTATAARRAGLVAKLLD